MVDRPRTLEGFKSYAKRLKKRLGITHTQALDMNAREFGFESYQHAFKHYARQEDGTND